MTNTYNAPCKVPVDLGFQLSHAKLVQPTQNLVFLGVQPDTVEMSVSKVMNLKTVIPHFGLLHWLQSSNSSNGQVSLIGPESGVW